MENRQIKGYVLAWDEECNTPGYDVNYWCTDENSNYDPDALTDEEMAEAIKGPYETDSEPDGNGGYAKMRVWTVYAPTNAQA